MTDLRARMQIYDEAPVPELWGEVTARVATVPGPGRVSTSRLWIALVAAAATVLMGGAVLVGSGVIELPILPQPVPAPTPIPSASPPATSGAIWIATGNMLVERSEGYTLTLLSDGRVLVVGRDAFADVAQAVPELFDPANLGWTATEPTLLGRQDHTATLLLDGRVLVAGGHDFEGIESLTSAELYDPTTGSWTVTGSMIAARGYHVAARLPDGRVLVAGGQAMVREGSGGSSVLVSSAEVYDPATETWSEVEGVVGAEPSTATLLNDGRVLVVGGRAPFVFDPVSLTWSQAGEPNSLHGVHTATLLLDGRVLIAGGGDCCEWSGFAEIFDPTTDTWTVTGEMVEPRGYFTSTLVSTTGRVLATGGGDGGSRGKPTAELFDPATGTWSATDDMLSARGWHEAVALADGRVLVVGGWSTGRGTNPHAEVYDPAGGT